MDILTASGYGTYAEDVYLASINRIKMWKLHLINNLK